MGYFKSTWKYFFSKGMLYMLLMVVPSFLIPFILSPSSLLDILTHMQLQDPNGYMHLFLRLFGFDYRYIWVGVIGLFLAVFLTAILFGAIDRHMRTGDFTLSIKRINVRMNYNISTAFRFVMAMFFLYLVFEVLCLLFFILWATVAKTYTSFYVLCFFALFIIGILLTIAVSIMILWPPFMLHTGLTSGNAFRMSFAQIKGSITKIAMNIIFLFLPFYVIMLLNSLFDWSFIIGYVFDALSVLLVYMFYIILMYTIFYDVTGLERMDQIKKRKINIWKIKNKPIETDKDDKE